MTGRPIADQPNAAYVDATAGVAGDMLLGALLDAGADVERVRGAIASLGVPGLGLRTEAARRGGLACLRAVITTPAAPDRPRHLADVLGHVGASDLGPAGKDLATRVFRLLAEAEGAVHGEPPEDVHFHEVGAFDSLADVVGSAAALEDLGLLRPGAVVCCSALAAGSGFVTSAHGRLPVPAPAVLHIAAAAGLTLASGDLASGDLASGDLAGERTTPTGAALLAAAATPGGFPAMTVRAVGTGGGGRDTADRPNITRVVIGVSSAERDLREGDVTVVESTVDDLDPRLWPSVLQAVRAAGAWDCWCTPIVGRHGRPGQVLTALCAEPVRRAVAAAIFAHTGTLGVRWSRMNRLTASRTSVAVEVGPPGHSQVVTVKVAGAADGLAGFGTATAELAEAEAAARVLGWPVRAVCEAALAQYRAQYRAQASAPRLQWPGGLPRR
jgi:pyridinium-3,5-bisthiocarboxylic acid mononucleotide nickel chelatase